MRDTTTSRYTELSSSLTMIGLPSVPVVPVACRVFYENSCNEVVTFPIAFQWQVRIALLIGPEAPS